MVFEWHIPDIGGRGHCRKPVEREEALTETIQIAINNTGCQRACREREDGNINGSDTERQRQYEYRLPKSLQKGEKY